MEWSHNFIDDAIVLYSIFGLLKTKKREGLSPSDIFTHFVRYLLEGASS